MFKNPTLKDWIILAVFTILITWQPYYLHGQLNFFELGLYLPGIDAIVHGKIPFRDFFYLRGPFELYLPAFLMTIFGENVAVLSTYFYVGTVITMILCVLIAKDLCQTRLFFYVLVPVLVARTFPRVVFTFWGGMRYAWGLLAIWCAIRFFKSRKIKWLIAAGILSAVNLFTSLEMGVFATVGILGALLFDCLIQEEKIKADFKSPLLMYGVGLFAVVLPYILYLVQSRAFFPYVDSTYNVLVNLYKVFPQGDPVSGNFLHIIGTLINPVSRHFKHLTPAYCFIFWLSYFIYRFRRREGGEIDRGVLCLFLYGLVMYLACFRNVTASAFEMALQPEKILYFLLLEKAFLFWKRKGNKVVSVLLIGMITFSFGYAIERYNKRFPAFQYVRNLLLRKSSFKLMPLNGQDAKRVKLNRISGMVLPLTQAEDLQQLVEFVNQHTTANDAIFMFPELAALSFIVDRPFVGRFPMVTTSWINDQWYQELFTQLKTTQPRFAVAPKVLPDYFYKTSLLVEKNVPKFYQMAQYIEDHYSVIRTTPTFNIYEHKGIK